MNKRIPFVSFVCLASSYLFACGSQSDRSAERTNDATLTQQQLLSQQVDNATLTLQEAIDIALAAHPNGQLLEADLDGKSTQPRFEIELLVGGEAIEVHVDAKTGEILQSIDEDSDGDDDRDDDGDSEHTCELGISLEEAVAIAESHIGGNAVEVENDDCAFEIVVNSASDLVEVDVAKDGTVGRVETENDDGDDRGDDDRDVDDRDVDDRDVDDRDDDDRDVDDRDDDDRDDDDRDAAVDCSTSITVDQATAIALEAAAGTVLRVEHDDKDDCDFEISVQTASGVVEVDIAADGTVNDVEQDD